jgi:hypothetical protein
VLREVTDGSLRSFDRELKARSRQFSDATSIVTMGGERWCSVSLSVLFLSLSLSLSVSSLGALHFSRSCSLALSLFLSLSGANSGYLSTIPSLFLFLLLHLLLPLSFSAQCPSACLSLPPSPRRRALAPYFPVFCGRFVNLSAAFIGACRCKRKSLPITYYCVSILQRA